MESMRLPAMCSYSMGTVALSVALLAIVISFRSIVALVLAADRAKHQYMELAKS